MMQAGKTALTKMTAAATCMAVMALLVAASAPASFASIGTDVAQAGATGEEHGKGASRHCQILKCANFLPVALMALPRPASARAGTYASFPEGAPTGHHRREDPPPPRPLA